MARYNNKPGIPSRTARKAAVGGVIATVIAAIIVTSLITPWIVMLILGALFPKAGIAFWQSLLGCVLVSIAGQLLRGHK